MYRVEEYVVFMRRRGLAETTIEKRRRCVEMLAAEYDLDAVTAEEVQQFLDRRGVGSRARYGWLSHLGCFYRWAVANERVQRDPVARLVRPKLRRLVPNPTPEREVEMAVSLAATPLQRQWVVLMAYAGLRCAEVAQLQGEDVDRAGGTIRVVEKGSKPRVIPIHPLVGEQLAAAPPWGPVFVDPATGDPYTAAQVSRLVGRYMRSLGCTHNRAHLLRHRFASQLLEQGADIADVAALLGHESLSTTTGYAAASIRRMRRALELIS